MDATLMQNVRSALTSKHYNVNEAWLRDCVDFYVNEHEQVSLDSLLPFIISQWQLSDLNEINNDKGSLPNNLAQQKCITLPSRYIVQMNSIYDISMSKYKQLEKIRNISTDNIEATEAENATQFISQINHNVADSYNNWEPKPKRMMQLELTDGKQTVTAIEHKPIHMFDDLRNVLPGFKVMIKGPVICRRGVILLEEKNILPVGGEVASLLIPNAIENILARTLKLKENPNPYDNIDSQSNPNMVSIENNISDSNMPSQNSNIPINQRTSNSQSNNSNKTNDMKYVVSVNNQASTSYNNMSSGNNSNKAKRNLMEDMFEDDLNMDINELEQIMEMEQQVSADWSDPMPVANIDQRKTNVTKSSERTISVISSEIDVKSKKDVAGNIFEVAGQVMDLTEDEWDNIEIPEVLTDENLKIHKTESLPSTSEEKSENKQKLEFMVNNIPLASSNLSKTVSESRQINMNYNSKTNNYGHKRSCNSISPPITTNPHKVRCSEKTLKNRKLTDFIKPISSSSNIPVDFLCDIQKESLTDSPIKKKIRGKLVKVTSKLSFNNNSEWNLSGIMTDNTSDINVTFSSKVLDEIFGFTVEEFRQRKKMKKQNPDIMNILLQELKCAEDKLYKLDSMVEIELCKNKDVLVTKISELTDEEKRRINAHVVNLKKK